MSREREAAEIVRYKKAAAVGRLILGELDGPMEEITAEQYLRKTRRELLSERDATRALLRGEIAKFCRSNFENLQAEDLADLYDHVSEHEGHWFLPLVEFEKRFGKFKGGVLRGAPLHSTIHISPWGLQTDFPEQHLVKDVGVAFNEAVDLDVDALPRYRGRPWRHIKSADVLPELAGLIRRRDASLRACVLSCFNLVEAFINGVAWDYVKTHDLSTLAPDDQNVLTESARPVGIIRKLVRIPTLILGKDSGPLHQTRDPLKSFIELVKPYRDAIVHASPFAAAERFGGYDKLTRLYELDLAKVRKVVDVTVAVITEVHAFIYGGDLPVWFPARAADGKFVIAVDALPGSRSKTCA